MSSPIPDDPEKKRIWIKYQLKIRGIYLSDIARRHEVSRQLISSALYKQRPRWEKVLANAINLMPEQLWPERYDEHGLPKEGVNECDTN